MADKKEVKVEKVEVAGVLTNNTKGLRGVNGLKLIPGKPVDLTREQVEAVNKNPVAMAWIKAGDLSLV